jgi:hypothetical protein
MELCSATIRLSGSLTNTVFKTHITPAEVLILQSIHGEDAVVDCKASGSNRAEHSKEWERLSSIYDNSNGVTTPDGENASIMVRLFPGAVKKLPITFHEIGMPDICSVAKDIRDLRGEENVEKERKLMEDELAGQLADAIPATPVKDLPKITLAENQPADEAKLKGSPDKTESELALDAVDKGDAGSTDALASMLTANAEAAEKSAANKNKG